MTALSSENPIPKTLGMQAEEYRFLLPRHLSLAELRAATVAARRTGVTTHEQIIASGKLTGSRYASALANHLRVPFAPPEYAAFLRPGPGAEAKLLPAKLLIDACHAQGKPPDQVVINAISATPTELQSLVRQGHRIALASPATLRTSNILLNSAAFLDYATYGLARRFPGESAYHIANMRPATWLLFLVAAIVIASVTLPGVVISVLMIVTGLAFAALALPRITALNTALSTRREPPSVSREPDVELPIYTLLIPLFREANVLPGLIEAIMAIDYPAAKLDIKLIFEETDNETQHAAAALKLPANFDIIVTPEGQPQTKPRALNYALQFAVGEYVVIYDAEDRPDPDQLHKSLAKFKTAPKALACCQASLNIYNPRDSWWTAQFTIEYSALFDAILPAYETLRFPIPLGGTSNHFRTAALRHAGGWDAFNVTEDADLGMRLARHGYMCTTLNSTTYEEAPITWSTWLPQRTRWMKGWMQTWLVERKRPPGADLWHRIGAQTILGGQLISALIHPWVYILLAITLIFDNGGPAANTSIEQFAWALAITNLLGSYLVAFVLGIISAGRRGWPISSTRLILTCLTLPIYWLGMSIAAYRALWQLHRVPFVWEKTPHGLSRSPL